MAGSGLGAAREAMLMKFLVLWVRLNAKKFPSEVGGIDVFSSIHTLSSKVQKGEIADQDTLYMYRLFRIAFAELAEHLEWLDSRYGNPLSTDRGQRKK